MTQPLWLPIVLLACVVFVQAQISSQYADCPKDCTCEQKTMAAILSCRRFITEKNLTANMSVSKFELVNIEGPITLGENVFLKMGLTHVNVISIANVTIESIDKNAFGGLTELSNIKIAHSHLSNLHPDTFKNIEHLKKLNLIGNPLSKDTVIASDTLEELRLAHCGLNEISAKVFEQAPSLTLLDLTGNGFEQLHPNVFDSLLNIREINLSHNKLKELPKGLFSKNKFDMLDLSNNPLSTFSSQHISELEELNLEFCLLTEIDENMFKNMSHLYNLKLNNNKINKIHPLAFTNIPQISTIDLSNNDLTSLDENLFVKNLDLQKLYLDNNYKLSELPVDGFNAQKPYFSIHYFSCNNCNLRSISRNTFKNMPSLFTLYLSHNNIQDISTGVFQNLVSLVDLDLSYNQITTIDDETFKNNRNLKKLNLSHNTLKSLHASIFYDNENLQYLDISNCGLFQLWTGTITNVNIPSILSLNVSNNKIPIITNDDLAVTNHLKSLDISNNNMQCTKELRDLIKYLEDEKIQNTAYVTHEQQSYDFEARVREGASWSSHAKALCPNILDEEEQEEMSEEEYEEETDPDDDEITEEEEEVTIYVEPELLHEDMILTYHHEDRYKYSYVWPIMVFLATALAVLGLVANIIMFVIRRRQSKPIPRIISISRMTPRLKTNSGLVYQQLSEELGGPKTPIFSRFAPIPSVHGNMDESEHV